jgi:DNA-binding PadR family transcriptional regulator
MSRKSKTKFTILGMLNTRPMTGYDIKKIIQRTTANFWSESTGQIYPTLEKLCKEKYVELMSESTRGARQKKEYKITSKGIDMLEEWLPQSAETPVVRDEMLLKLFFGKSMSNTACIAHIRRRQRLLEDHLELLQDAQKRIHEKRKDKEDAKYWLLTINNGLYSIEAKLRWCQDSIKQLEQEK